jgi:hypothetical protein
MFYVRIHIAKHETLAAWTTPSYNKTLGTGVGVLRESPAPRNKGPGEKGVNHGE